MDTTLKRHGYFQEKYLCGDTEMDKITRLEKKLLDLKYKCNCDELNEMDSKTRREEKCICNCKCKCSECKR